MLLALMGVSLVAPSVQAAPRTGVRPTDDELARRMLTLVNAARDHHGLATLTMNHRLSGVALRHSKRMARSGTISHTSNLGDLVRSEGGSVYGEDLAKGRGLRGILDAWLERTDTRRILLDPRFRRSGVGVVHVNGFYWVTFQAFD
jgi:uncharacterized protein YkwD